ncbi:MAG: hypothetical protein ACYDC3_10080 [Candidatus Binataceae bacterium]
MFNGVADAVTAQQYGILRQPENTNTQIFDNSAHGNSIDDAADDRFNGSASCGAIWFGNQFTTTNKSCIH